MALCVFPRGRAKRQLRVGTKVLASANTEFGAVTWKDGALGRANTPLLLALARRGAAGSIYTPRAR